MKSFTEVGKEFGEEGRRDRCWGRKGGISGRGKGLSISEVETAGLVTEWV